MVDSEGVELLASVVTGVVEFLEAEVIPRHDGARSLFENPRNLFDEQGRYVPDVIEMIREVRMASAAAGFYTMFVPEELGGGGMSPILMYHVYESIFRRCAAHYWLGWHMIGHWAKGPSLTIAKLHPSLRSQVLPGLMQGDTSMCFAISEPDAGSDLWAMRTVSDRQGDTWRINGTKQWITNSPYADYILVFAADDRASHGQRSRKMTAFLLPKDAPGLQVQTSIRMFGHLGGDEGVVVLEDVEATSENVVGEVGRGTEIAALGIGLGKLYNAAKSVGIGRWAMSLAAEQVTQRTTFGRPLSDRQGIMFPLADSAIELNAARLVALDAAARITDSVADGAEVAMMKVYTSEVGLRAVDRVIQAHGASGLTNELHLTEAWMQLRKICIADGTAELMRQQIGRAIVSGRLKF